MGPLDLPAPDVSALARLPKVELHCHIEGTMRPGTVFDLAASHGIALPRADVTDLYDYEDLTGFLDVFWLVQSLLRTPQDWERLAYESVIDGAAHGLRYREAFFTPTRHLVAGQSLADIVAALDRGLAAGEAESGVRCALIFDIDRDFGPVIAAEQIGELVAGRRSGRAGFDRVIGMGMDSTELGIDPLSFRSAYEQAPAGGLRRTAHQGENSGAAAIRDAIEGLGCERIDHGISIFEDPALVRTFAERQIPLTVCPNANVRINPGVVTDIGGHVFPQMRSAGLLATLNTDDPALVGLDLTQEYALCAAAFGYDFDDMVSVAVDGVRASWLDIGEAASLVSEIHAAAAANPARPSVR